MTKNPVGKKNGVFAAVFLVVFFALVLGAWGKLPRFDPPIYFEFADRRVFFGVSNSMDVLSNLAFLWVGIHWWRFVSMFGAYRPYYRFIAAVSVLTALGSAWFHWNPNVETLFWDRLPMTLGFSGMIGLIVADRFSGRVGGWLTFALVFLSVGHLILWNAGLSDLRPYILLQYGGILFASTLVAIRWKWGTLSNRFVAWAFLLYGVAKITEAKDLAIFEFTGGTISGHTVKHLLAAWAIDRLFKAGSPR